MSLARLATCLLLLGSAAWGQALQLGPPEFLDYDGLPGITDLGDVDGDGDADLVVVVDEQIRLHDNPGGFGPLFGAPILVSRGSGRPRLGDANGDGHVDLVLVEPMNAGGSPGAGDVLLFPGDGAGGFASPQTLLDDPALGVPSIVVRDVRIADFTGDGLPDLLLLQGLPGTSPANAPALRIMVGLGAGAFDVPVLIDDLGTLYPSSAAVGDLDLDGVADVVVAAEAQVGGAGSVRVVLGGAGGLPALVSSVGTIGFAHSVALADLDGDGLLDLVIGSQTAGVAWKRGLGNGSFGAASLVTSTGLIGDGLLATADLDGNGQLDLAAVEESSRNLFVWLGQGGGAFLETDTGAHLFPANALCAADLDGSGRNDLAVNQSNHFSVLRNLGYGPGSAWAPLGGSKAQVSSSHPHTPFTYAEGTLAEHTPLTLQLSRNGVVSNSAYLVLGASELNLPFKGGLLVPSPDALLGPFPAAGDTLLVEALMPAWFPPGTPITLQWWLPGVPNSSVAATAAVRGVTP